MKYQAAHPRWSSAACSPGVAHAASSWLGWGYPRQHWRRRRRRRRRRRHRLVHPPPSPAASKPASADAPELLACRPAVPLTAASARCSSPAPIPAAPPAAQPRPPAHTHRQSTKQPPPPPPAAPGMERASRTGCVLSALGETRAPRNKGGRAHPAGWPGLPGAGAAQAASPTAAARRARHQRRGQAAAPNLRRRPGLRCCLRRQALPWRCLDPHHGCCCCYCCCCCCGCGVDCACGRGHGCGFDGGGASAGCASLIDPLLCAPPPR
eukprot:COSAG01_NODE_2247_length_8072_cov_48.931704_10_plen_266_part_00